MGVEGGVMNLVLVRPLPGGKDDGSLSMTRGAGRDMGKDGPGMTMGVTEDAEDAVLDLLPRETLRMILPLAADELREPGLGLGNSSDDGPPRSSAGGT